MVLATSAQSLYNDALLTINGAVLAVSDSVVNKGILDNNGQLLLSGSWNNLGDYTPGTGSVVLRGSGKQYVDQHAQSFASLTIDGGSDKFLLSDMTVSNELTFVAGHVIPLGYARVRLSKGAVVSGAGDEGHVVGSVQWTGAGSWIFPVGNGEDYLPVQIMDISDPDASGLVREFDCDDQLQPDPTIASISGQRYWIFTAYSGSLDGARIGLVVRNDQGLASEPDQLVVSWAPSLPGPFVSLGQSSFSGSLSSGGITSSGAPASGFYALATLPGELPAIDVFNALSINGDNQNEYLRIGEIERFPRNTVSIFNRWGDKVFEMEGYNNEDRVFAGERNVGQTDTLPPATYFYKIDPGDGSNIITGYIVIRR